MTIIDGIDYGPLASLIGEWKGSEGIDIAPEKEGIEENPFYETIVFEAGGNVTNAEEQTLAVVPYTQAVKRIDSGKALHHQVGYWLWDVSTGMIMQNFAIPRAVALVAGGEFQGDAKADSVILEVKADCDGDFGIVQSPFMHDKAKTVSFRQTLSVSGDTLRYTQTTVLDIYGKTFDHTDSNVLQRA